MLHTGTVAAMDTLAQWQQWTACLDCYGAELIPSRTLASGRGRFCCVAHLIAYLHSAVSAPGPDVRHAIVTLAGPGACSEATLCDQPEQGTGGVMTRPAVSSDTASAVITSQSSPRMCAVAAAELLSCCWGDQPKNSSHSSKTSVRACVPSVIRADFGLWIRQFSVLLGSWYLRLPLSS